MTDSYLKKLAANDDVLNEFNDFLKLYVVNTEALLNIIEALKCKLFTDDLDQYFELLRPYVETHKPKTVQLLKLSHVICTNCDIYKPSTPSNWIKNNPELFETDVSFLYYFMEYFDLKNDASSFPLKDVFDDDPYPVSEQTLKEKLKTFNTIVKHYKHLV